MKSLDGSTCLIEDGSGDSANSTRFKMLSLLCIKKKLFLNQELFYMANVGKMYCMKFLVGLLDFLTASTPILPDHGITSDLS